MWCSCKKSKCSSILYQHKYNVESKEVLVPLYSALIRLHLEYCIQSWVGIECNAQHWMHFRKGSGNHIIPRREEQMIRILERKPSECLKVLSMVILEQRLLGDMIVPSNIWRVSYKTGFPNFSGFVDRQRGGEESTWVAAICTYSSICTNNGHTCLLLMQMESIHRC